MGGHPPEPPVFAEEGNWGDTPQLPRQGATPCTPAKAPRPPHVPAARDTAGAAAIRARIAARGAITFAAFMELALYQPRYGYYSALRVPPGPRGDFYTSPETHPAFGALVARQALEVWERLGRPRSFVVEEWGAGSGRLAADFLDAACGLAPGFAASIRYVIVERSAALRRFQQRLLRSWTGIAGRRVGAARGPGATGRGPETPEMETGAEGAVSWSRPPSSAARAAKTAASTTSTPTSDPRSPAPYLVLANELLDAFAVHRVVRRGDELRELYVDVAGDGLATREGPLSTPELAAYFARLGLLPPEGAIAEVNLGALAWLRAIAARLERGVVLLFDYGHPAEVLYSARYPRGTLRAYYRHGVDDDPYARVGEQDLTSHVDLTSLLLEGRAAGLVPLGLARQRDFLARLGLGDHEAAVRAAGLSAADSRASLTGLAALARRGGLGDYWVVGFGRGLAGPLHGLDEQATPLSAEPRPEARRPRLGWGDTQTHDAPRHIKRRGAL